MIKLQHNQQKFGNYSRGEVLNNKLALYDFVGGFVKCFKPFVLMLGIVLICVGCSEKNGEEEIESFLNTYYNVQYEESNKLMDKIDRQLEENEAEVIVSSDTPKFGEIYPKTFAPYFTEEAFELSLKNGVFRFLPQIAMGKEANYEVQSLKQLSAVEKEDRWEFAYEVALNEVIGDKVTSYLDEVRFYTTEENGEWKISNIRIFNKDYAK